MIRRAMKWNSRCYVYIHIYTYIHTYIYIYIYKHFKRKKDATTFSRQACFVNRFTLQGFKSEAIHETGLSGKCSCVLFPLKIFILLYFNVLSTVPRENRLADFLYIYII